MDLSVFFTWRPSKRLLCNPKRSTARFLGFCGTWKEGLLGSWASHWIDAFLNTKIIKTSNILSQARVLWRFVYLSRGFWTLNFQRGFIFPLKSTVFFYASPRFTKGCAHERRRLAFKFCARQGACAFFDFQKMYTSPWSVRASRGELHPSIKLASRDKPASSHQTPFHGSNMDFWKRVHFQFAPSMAHGGPQQFLLRGGGTFVGHKGGRECDTK